MRRFLMLALAMLLAVPVWAAPTEGGPVGPGGVEVLCDVPVALRKHNTAGKGGRGGLCVFTSIMHAARYQNERALWDFQDQVRNDVTGGYPGNVDEEIRKYGPTVRYLQYEGRDPSILEAALRTGRMPGVTYNGHDGVHYRGLIAHMVNLVYLDSQYAAILDNNWIQDNQLVWMTRQEFLERWTGGGSGWAVILLNPAPAPVPHP
jgi:hypothetical protein